MIFSSALNRTTLCLLPLQAKLGSKNPTVSILDEKNIHTVRVGLVDYGLKYHNKEGNSKHWNLGRSP
jgi:hypothetical protein